MALTATVYGSVLRSLANKEIDLDGDTLKVMLCSSAYTPSQAAHRYTSDVTGEITGAGYTAGGATLTGVAVHYAGSTLTVDCDDIVWQGASFTARYAVFYNDTPTSAKPLLLWWDFGTDTVSSSGPFTMATASTGLLQLTAA